jgi:probable phosphoglycerate mutase
MRLKNRYFAMRHGYSVANEQGIIVSDPASGMSEEYGLSAKGRKQVELAARRTTLGAATLIFSSDFSRTRQTAEIVRTIIGSNEIVLTPTLRERYFGDWEKTSNTNYEKVWPFDREFSDRHENNVEAVSSVVARTLQLIADIEQMYSDKDILLISHGDTIQILQAVMCGLNPRDHRDLLHLETAEIRQLA